MHILHLDSESTWRGGENQIRLLVEGLLSQNVRTSLACAPSSQLFQRMEGSVQIVAVRMRSELDLVAAFKIAKFCKTEDVSILDCHSSHAHSIGLLVKRFFWKEIKLVVHRRVDFKPSNGYFNRLKYLNSAIDAYIGISEAICQILKSIDIEPSRVFRVPSAVDELPYQELCRQDERGKWFKLLNLDESTTLIGQAAAMTEQKGYKTLLEALAILKQKGLKFHCAIAGIGENQGEYEKLSHDLGLDSDVTFLGWVDEIPSFLSSVDIFAMPSNFEGLGTVALEAMYAGCCVVASRVGGISESIIHGKTGLLAPPRGHKEFAKQLEVALGDGQLRLRLNQAGKEHCKQEFSLEAMVRGNLDVYTQLSI